MQNKEAALPGDADYINTQLRIIASGLIRQRVYERLGRPREEVDEQIVDFRVGPVWKTSFMKITVSSLLPVIGADYANAIAEEYLNYKTEERMDTSQATIISLTHQANRIREELRKSEEKVIQFEKDNSVVAIQERGNVAAKYLASLSSRAAEYRTEKMLLESQQPMLEEASGDVMMKIFSRSSGPLYNPSSARGSGAEGSNSYQRVVGPESLIHRGVVAEHGWANLSRRKARLQSTLDTLRTRFRDTHPEIQRVKNEAEDVERQLQVELDFALKSYYAQLEALSIKERAVRRAELEWEDDALDVSKKAHTYNTLNRNVERLRSLYDLIFNRLKEVDISLGMEPETINIMERAYPASIPQTQAKFQSILLAALIGLGVGLALVFGLEYLDDSLRYPEEVEEQLGLPFLGVIPSANWDPDDLNTHLLSNMDQKSGLAEAYRNVRSALLFSGREASHVIAVTSSIPKEGKTTTCLNLAVSLAHAGSRVLLVDTDLRRGELHKFFGLEGGKGISDVLVGRIKPESVVQRTGIPNLDLVATGPFPPNPAELVLRKEFNVFMDYARMNYDRVMLDCPPVMAVSESSNLAAMADGALMVVWAGQTSRKLSQLTVQVLRERGANLLGVVLNNLEFGRVGYYYYSTYYGYYDYDYSYEGESSKPSESKI